MDLSKLLKPKSIAVIGANEKAGSFGNYSAINALQNGGNVNVYFVNLKSPEVLGHKTYPTIKDLPEVPDCILIATPAKTCAALLEEAGRSGVKAAIIEAAGFSEEGTEEGKRAEEELIRIARKYDMAVMGPNCIGFVNNIDKVKLWGMAGTDFDMNVRKTGVAFFAQSGTMSIHAVSCPYIDVSYVFSMGNSTMVMVEDVMEYVLEEPEVRMLAIYLEGVRDGRRFMNCLKRADELGKPVVIHAAGMSKKGAAAAASHTGNIASSRGVYQAVCEKYGAILVESIDEFLCATNVLATWLDRMPKGSGISAINGSGGENAVCADLSELYDVPLPDFEEGTITALKELLPGFANPRNPLDITAITSDVYTVMMNVLTTVGDDKNVDAVICSIASFAEPNEKDIEQAKVFGESLNERYARPMIDYVKKPGAVPVLCIPMTEDRRDAQWRRKLQEAGIPILANSLIGYKVLGKICKYIEYKKVVHTLENAVPEQKHGEDTVSLSEADSKKELYALDLPIPKQSVVKTKEELKKAVSGMKYPLVLKVSSADILHKTEAGGVQLGIEDGHQAEKAFDEIMENCRTYKPDAVIDGILVQEQAEPGVEMILGITSDAHFGPMLMAGMGGVFVEIFKDAAMYPCPLNKEEALRMLQGLKAYKLLKGYRGSSPCDIEALTDVMVKLSRYAKDHRDEIKEMDLNPVFVYPEGQGVSIIDALIIKYKDRKGGEQEENRKSDS